MKISPCFTHPQAIVYDFLLSDESNQSYIKKLSLLRSSAKLNKSDLGVYACTYDS